MGFFRTVFPKSFFRASAIQERAAPLFAAGCELLGRRFGNGQVIEEEPRFEQTEGVNMYPEGLF